MPCRQDALQLVSGFSIKPWHAASTRKIYSAFDKLVLSFEHGLLSTEFQRMLLKPSRSTWQASWVVVVWQSMDGSGKILLAILCIFSMMMPRQGVAERCELMQALPMAMPYQQIVAQFIMHVHCGNDKFQCFFIKPKLKQWMAQHPHS